MIRLLIALSVLLFAGCKTDDVTPPQVAPQGPAASAELGALRDQVTNLSELAQRASGAVYGATDANRAADPSPVKDAVDAQLAEAASALPEPTEAQKLVKAEQNARILAGQLDEVRKEMGVAMDENAKLRRQVEDSAARMAALEAAAAKEREASAAAIRSAQAELVRKLEQAKRDADDAIKKEQVRLFNWIGVGLAGLAALSFGLIVGFGGLAGIKQGAVIGAAFGYGSVLAFAMARFLGSDWFWWVVGGSLGVGVIAAVAVFVLSYRKQRKAQADADELDVAWDALRAIVPALDRARAEAKGEVKEFLESDVFKRIEENMKTKAVEVRDYLHDVRKRKE